MANKNINNHFIGIYDNPDHFFDKATMRDQKYYLITLWNALDNINVDKNNIRQRLSKPRYMLLINLHPVLIKKFIEEG